MIQIMKKQGLKAALPILLLATACGEGAPSAQQFDTVTPEAYEQAKEAIAANPDVYKDLQALVAASAEPADLAEAIEVADKDMKLLVLVPPTDNSIEKVPEPMTLAGLAIAAVGLGTLKRKQTA